MVKSTSILRVLFFLAVVISALVGVLIYRAYVIFKPCEHNVKPLADSLRTQLSEKALARLIEGLRFPTVSYSRHEGNLEAKRDFVKFIRSGKIKNTAQAL